MSLVESLLGYRNFAGEHEICRRIEQSKFYDSSKESTEDAASLFTGSLGKNRVMG